MGNPRLVAVVLAIVGLTAWFAWPRRAHFDHHMSVLGNLMRVEDAKEQWKIENTPPAEFWPSKSDIVRYLSRTATETFEDFVRPLAGEIYIANRADRPVAVYLTKDAFGFTAGQLLTMEDIKENKKPKE